MSSLAIMLGGTSILIVINVLNDTISQFKIAGMSNAVNFGKE